MSSKLLFCRIKKTVNNIKIETVIKKTLNLYKRLCCKKENNQAWTKTGRCADCKVWKDCLGNGMHNWHGPAAEVLQCHYARTL